MTYIGSVGHMTLPQALSARLWSSTEVKDWAPGVNAFLMVLWMSKRRHIDTQACNETLPRNPEGSGLPVLKFYFFL